MSDYKTHFNFALFISIAICGVVFTRVQQIIPEQVNLVSMYIIICIMCCLGSLFPDIDCINSKVGSKVKILSVPINNIFGHRTVTHSIVVTTMFLAIYTIFIFVTDSQTFNLIVSISSFYIGILTHIFLDMTTVSGVPIFYPISDKRYTLNDIAFIVVLTIGLIAVYLTF